MNGSIVNQGHFASGDDWLRRAREGAANQAAANRLREQGIDPRGRGSLVESSHASEMRLSGGHGVVTSRRYEPAQSLHVDDGGWARRTEQGFANKQAADKVSESGGDPRGRWSMSSEFGVKPTDSAVNFPEHDGVRQAHYGSLN